LRDYEAVYIFDSALEEARINEKLDRFHGLLTGGERGQITAVDHWGKRQMAYAIQDKENGYYVVSHFSAQAEALPEFERILKLDDEVLRYLIVVNEGDLTTSPAARPERSTDDEDDDDTEDE
jgi:small subunit ribosomal protein S6